MSDYKKSITIRVGPHTEYLTIPSGIENTNAALKVDASSPLGVSFGESIFDGAIIRGTWDPATGLFPGDGNAIAGDTYIASGPGTVDGISFQTGDRVLALVNNASTTIYDTNWYQIKSFVLSVNGYNGEVSLLTSDIPSAPDHNYVTDAELLTLNNNTTDVTLIKLDPSVSFLNLTPGTQELVLGRVAVGDIAATGSPSATSFLRGDSTWTTLGSAAYNDSTDFATAAQGALADSAVQPTDINSISNINTFLQDGNQLVGKLYVDNAISAATHSPVSVTDTAEINLTLSGQNIKGELNILSIAKAKLTSSVQASLNKADNALQPGEAELNVQADWNETNVNSDAFILNKPSLNFAAASHTHALNDLSDVDTTGSINGYVLTYDNGTWLAAQQTGGGGGGVTNLSYDAPSRLLSSSSGTDVPLPLADGTNAGLLSNTDFNKLGTIESNATADQTPAEILAALLTVDGSGTGLDADLLDGLEATAFATAAQGSLADSSLQPGDEYTDADVDTHLNVSPTAPIDGYVLSWTAGDYLWVAQSGGGGLNAVVEDTSPQLGGALDVNGQEITGAIDLHSTGDLVIELGDAVGANKVSVLDNLANEQASINSDGKLLIQSIDIGSVTGVGNIVFSGGGPQSIKFSPSNGPEIGQGIGTELDISSESTINLLPDNGLKVFATGATAEAGVQFKLGDSAGVTRFWIEDQGSVEVFEVDSDGNITMDGNITLSTPGATVDGVDISSIVSYTDAAVDNHLNTSTAAANEVLSWTGGDYAWVAQSGGGGGGTVQGTDTNTYNIRAANEGITAGGARGENNVDLQTFRATYTDSNSNTVLATDQVAGGTLSFYTGTPCNTIGGGAWNSLSTGYFNVIAGGAKNTISGSYNARCTISGGYENWAHGDTAVIAGGYNNEAGPVAYCTVSGGYLNTASGSHSTIIGGDNNRAEGSRSVVLGGEVNIASGTYSIASGRRAKAYGYGHRAHASGMFSVNGDAQHSIYTLRRQVTHVPGTWYALGAAAGDPVNSGNINAIVIPLDTVFTGRATIVGTTNGGGKTFGFEILFTAHNSGGFSELKSSSVTTIDNADDTTYDARVDVQISDPQLRIEVSTSASTDAVRWVSTVDITQVTWGV